MKATIAAVLFAIALFPVAAQESLIMKTVNVKAPVEEVWKAWSTGRPGSSRCAPTGTASTRKRPPRKNPDASGAFGVSFRAAVIQPAQK